MKIVFFGFVTAFGGGPQGTVYLSKRLSQNNEIYILDAYGICDKFVESVRKNNLNLHILYPSAKRTYIGYNQNYMKRLISFLMQAIDLLRLRKRLVEKILEINPDAIWCNGPGHKSACFLFSSLKLGKIPKVMYVRGWATSDQLSWINKFFIKHKFAAVIAHSMATIKQLQKIGLKKERLFYTPNTIDVQQVDYNNSCLIAIDKFEKKPVILVPVARPVKEKGVHTVIKAVEILKRKNIFPAVLIPGEIPVGASHQYIDWLRSLISKCGVENQVHFIGWVENLPAVMKFCDIVVLPSYTEGFPRSILEAMYLKKAVIATSVGGIPEAIKDGKTGYLIDIEDHEGLAQKIEQLMDRSTYTTISTNAHQFFWQHHTPEKNTKGVLAAIEFALEKTEVTSE